MRSEIYGDSKSINLRTNVKLPSAFRRRRNKAKKKIALSDISTAFKAFSRTFELHSVVETLNLF